MRHLAAQDSDATSDRILYLLHAVGARRCDKDCHGCTEGCMSGGTKNGIAPAPPPSAQVCCEQGNLQGSNDPLTISVCNENFKDMIQFVEFISELISRMELFNLKIV